VAVEIQCTTNDGRGCNEIVPTCASGNGTETLSFDIAVNNSGTVDMLITLLDFFLTGDIDYSSLLGAVTTNPLAPGESTSLQFQRLVDLCKPFIAAVYVEGNPQNGDTCQDSAQYDFTVPAAPTPPPTPPTPVPPTPAETPTVVGTPTPPATPTTPNFPTIMPNRAPASSPVPTMDVLTADCVINAEIQCEALRDGSIIGACEDIQDPRNVTCSNGLIPTEISFIYKANGGPATVTVKATVKDTESTFSVQDGQIFTVKGDFTNGAMVSFEVGGISIGAPISIDTSCNGSADLNLGTQFGPLELVGFVNADGIFTSVYQLEVSYVITNGPTEAQVNTVTITSDFEPGPIEALTAPVDLPAGATQVVYNDTTVVDALEKFRQGVTFDFQLDVTASGRISNLPCVANATFSF
jgi:hypothetical protein